MLPTLTAGGNPRSQPYLVGGPNSISYVEPYSVGGPNPKLETLILNNIISSIIHDMKKSRKNKAAKAKY